MKRFKRIITRKSNQRYLIGYLLGLLTIPFLQLAITDIGQAIIAVVPFLLVTIVILNGMQTIIQQTLLQYQTLQQRQQIMRDIRSSHRQVVEDAMSVLVDRNWHLGDGSYLRGLESEAVRWSHLHLNGANLQNAELYRAELDDTWLEHANLRDADLSMATLQDVKLSYADLTNAKVMTSDLRGANLHGTICHNTRLAHSNLGGAILMGTDLRGADLTRVNLQGARFIQYAKFDRNTILPTAKLISRDGAHSKILNLNWRESFDWTPYQTGEAYRGYSDEWKAQMGWVDPSQLPAIDEDVQTFLA